MALAGDTVAEEVIQVVLRNLAAMRLNDIRYEPPRRSPTPPLRTAKLTETKIPFTPPLVSREGSHRVQQQHGLSKTGQVAEHMMNDPVVRHDA